MSGAGRKSNYRKSVTTNFLTDDRTPESNEKVVLVLGNRGDGTFGIQFPGGQKRLATLPQRFNKLIWIKTGDYVLVVDETGETHEAESTSPDTTKEFFGISHILSKANIKFLKARSHWPAEF
ncbi:hypothetical protein B484DRAFT_297250, partial [Ochromonadaceae sp. CCMP2298]